MFLLVLVLVSTSGHGSPLPQFAFGLAVLTFAFRRAIRLHAIRRRVGDQFAAGGADVEPVRTDVLELTEGGTRREFLWGLISAVVVMVTGGFIAWGVVDGKDTLAWPLLIVVILAIWGCVHVIEQYSQSLAKQSIKKAKPPTP